MRSKSNRLSMTALLVAASLGHAADASAGEADVVRSLERYCTTCWKNAGIAAQDWDDCTQEAIAELLGRIARDRLDAAIANGDSAERRELNRSVWCAAQRWRRAKRPQPLGERDVSGRDLDEELAEDRQHLRELLEDVDLSPRQQRILESSLEGGSVAEIAEELRLPPARVSDEKYKAIRKLQRKLTAA